MTQYPATLWEVVLKAEDASLTFSSRSAAVRRIKREKGLADLRKVVYPSPGIVLPSELVAIYQDGVKW